MDYSNLKLPYHVAIIVDGNGRWANEKGLKRRKGHDAGYKNLVKLSSYIFAKGIKYLSVYVFSTENFKRDEEEVNHIMNLFVKGFKKDSKRFKKDQIKVIFSGRKEPLKKEVLEVMEDISNKTKNNNKGVFNICLNYGGRSEIIDATKKIVESKIKTNNINEELFAKYLYNELPDVDLMIRTSGELRLSNFMLWQNSYAEFYFPKTYFPDFNEEEFDKAIIEYNKRDRRFGDIKKNK